jgi:PleD family two-component response regulator
MEKKRVLVVDDDEGVLMAVKMELEGTKQYEIDTLSDPRNIIAQVNVFKPDIIILDILMPALGGIEVCEMLKEDPVSKDIPIIALSALKKTADNLKVFKPGVVDYCIKPMDKNELISKIEKALNRT